VTSIQEPSSWLGGVVQALEAGGVDPAALGLAWARVTPTVVLVPAFGLRALPAPARGVLGLALAACLFPALRADAHSGAPWAALAVLEMLRGVPVAIAAAVPLWAATMAGGVVDALRASSDYVTSPVVEGRPTPLGVPFSLLASAIFLGTGGPARAAEALATRSPGSDPLEMAVGDLAGGIGLAVALAAPILAAAVVLELGLALLARAASPAQVQALVAPLRALGILVVLAIVFERMAGFLARTVGAAPHP
jgi:flagellar biosynthesis protein FliR